jgi:hypothetical protein
MSCLPGPACLALLAWPWRSSSHCDVIHPCMYIMKPSTHACTAVPSWPSKPATQCQAISPPSAQLTSDNDNMRKTMHEIDFEFINAWPASAPGGIWTNSFINGLLQLEQLWMPWDVTARTGSKGFDTFSDYHEYTIDWQPTHMRWFVDGGLIDERLDDSYQMPYEKSYVTLSFWTNTDGPWAGNLPVNHPKLYSNFQGVLKRIVCDVPGNAVQLTGVGRRLAGAGLTCMHPPNVPAGALSVVR